MASTKKSWGLEERTRWFQSQKYQRSYHEDVLTRIESFSKDDFDIIQYGSLSIDESKKYPLFAIKTKAFNNEKQNVLVTGGVHGYETSGVAGTIEFIETQAVRYSKEFNIVIVPCVSPWAYETINRWNSKADDPNRSFIKNGLETEEAKLLMKYISDLSIEFVAHIDCHETTDTDETIFGPTKAERDGTDYEPGIIPDGFYLCGDSVKPELEFQKACLDSVRKVTHIAPADSEGMIIGTPISAEGVILYPVEELGLCISMTTAKYRTTTEVYPDSPKATPEICSKAQVACICGGLDYVFENGR